MTNILFQLDYFKILKTRIKKKKIYIDIENNILFYNIIYNNIYSTSQNRYIPVFTNIFEKP